MTRKKSIEYKVNLREDEPELMTRIMSGDFMIVAERRCRNLAYGINRRLKRPVKIGDKV